ADRGRAAAHHRRPARTGLRLRHRVHPGRADPRADHAGAAARLAVALGGSLGVPGPGPVRPCHPLAAGGRDHAGRRPLAAARRPGAAQSPARAPSRGTGARQRSAACLGADPRLQRGEGDRQLDPPDPAQPLRESRSHRGRRRLGRRHLGRGTRALRRRTARAPADHSQRRQGACGEYRGAVVVALDADTQFEPETIPRLVRWFADPTVGAVAGNAKVGNRINLITVWQALEYITAQNLERRALAALGAITVVPGAVGAWRREALEQLGGFPADTLAEDQDLTLAVQKAGYQTLFDADAIAWTEAPDTARGLARQRFRWSYGTLQCLWKHRDATFRPRYRALGMVALPQVWLFQILFSVVSPLVDLVLVWQIAATSLDYLQHRGQFDDTNLLRMLAFYAAFMAVDLGASALAFAMEKKEKWSLLWWLVLQRFGYRQLMYYVVVRSVWTAIKGPSVGWGRQERKATVSAGGGTEH